MAGGRPPKSIDHISSNAILQHLNQMKYIEKEELYNASRVAHGDGGYLRLSHAIRSLEILGALLSQLCGSDEKPFDDDTITSVTSDFCALTYGGNPELASLDTLAKARVTAEYCTFLIIRLYEDSTRGAHTSAGGQVAIIDRISSLLFGGIVDVVQRAFPEDMRAPWPSNRESTKEFLVEILRSARKMRLNKFIISYPPFREFFVAFQPTLALSIDYVKKFGIGTEGQMLERDLLSPLP
jgi:hypothetical protein